MKKRLILVFMGIASGLFIGTSAMALGIGAYIEAGGGESYRSVRSKSLESTGGTLTDYSVNAGIIIDTCVACDNVFSYRLKIGGGKARSDFMAPIDYNSFNMSHTFAFAAVKNDYVKFWIGPQIGVNFRRGSSDRLFFGTEVPGPGYFILYSSDFPALMDFFHFDGYNERTKYSIFGANGGLAFGLNLNMGDYVSLSFEAGVRYGYNTGRQDREVYNIKSLVAFNRFKSERIIEHGPEGYGSFAFMFRAVDTYQ